MAGIITGSQLFLTRSFSLSRRGFSAVPAREVYRFPIAYALATMNFTNKSASA
jgi:hypothetical protein